MAAPKPKPQVTFVETAGVLEFTNKLIVKPITVADAAIQGLSKAEYQQARTSAIAAINSAGGSSVYYEPALDHYVLEVPSGKTENILANEFLQTGNFLWAEPNYKCYPVACSNDPFVVDGQQWHHAKIESCVAWEDTIGSSDVTIAVCDTGVDITHPDLQSYRKEGYNAVYQLWETQGGIVSDDNNHGTHCTGIAAGNGNNGIGISGVGQQFSHRALKVNYNEFGFSAIEYMTHAIRIAADKGDKIVSFSYSGGYSQAIRDAASYAFEKGTLVFFAAGNDGFLISERPAHPIVYVGATDINDARSSFSNYGPGVNLWAPGSNILSAVRVNIPNGSYRNLSGTSMATPMAAGVAGLVWSKNPGLTAAEVRQIVIDSADTINIIGKNNVAYSVKRINSKSALFATPARPAPIAPPISPTTTASSVVVEAAEEDLELVTNNVTEIGKPKDRSEKQPLYCQFPNRLAITGFILDCIRQLFLNSRNITHPQIQDFFWAKDPIENPLKAPYQLVIEDAFNFDINKAGIRPAILVKAGAWQESRLVIGDNGMQNETYHKRVNGQHSIQVVAKSIAQAELLAREVQGYLSHFGPLLREFADLIKWEVPVLQEPSKLEEQSENVVISINVTYELIYSWDLQPDTSRLIRQIVFNAIINSDNET